MDKRCMNAAEKACLERLSEKYKDILTCKRTDVKSVNQRKLTWEKIAEEFNSVPEYSTKTAKQLLKSWENVKARKRKALRREKMNATASVENPDPYYVKEIPVLIENEIPIHPKVKKEFIADFEESSTSITDVQKAPVSLVQVPNDISVFHQRSPIIQNELALNERNRILLKQETEIHALRFREHQLRVEEQQYKTELAKLLLEREIFKM